MSTPHEVGSVSQCLLPPVMLLSSATDLMQWGEGSPVPLALPLAQQHEHRLGLHHRPSWISLSSTEGLPELLGGALGTPLAGLPDAALTGSSTGLPDTALVAAWEGVSGSNLSASKAGAPVLTLPRGGTAGALCSSLVASTAWSSKPCMHTAP